MEILTRTNKILLGVLALCSLAAALVKPGVFAPMPAMKPQPILRPLVQQPVLKRELIQPRKLDILPSRKVANFANRQVERKVLTQERRLTTPQPRTLASVPTLKSSTVKKPNLAHVKSRKSANSTKRAHFALKFRKSPSFKRQASR